MYPKYIIILLCIMFIFTCGVSASTTTSISFQTRGEILYVGGIGPNNYSVIQDAVDNASSGDTIFVYSGVYSDYFPDQLNCVDIDKPLNLVGENKHTTIINGSGRYDVIGVHSDDVKISGFTLQNGGTVGTTKYGRGLSLQIVNNVTVFDMILTKNYLAIIHFWNKEINIHNVTIIDNGRGIYFWDGINCFLIDCTIKNSGTGIEHSGYPLSAVNSFFIKNSHFIENSCGIYLRFNIVPAYGITTIQNNCFINNSRGIKAYTSKGVNIIENNFIGNQRHAIVEKECFIRNFFTYLNYKQNWNNNYWDDWDQQGSYLIKGVWTFYIGIHHSMFNFPIFKPPYREYDPDPANEPHDMGV